MKPNEAQQDAMSYFEGPCLVLAGPGSGKTYTIAKRIDKLIYKHQVRPEEILVITFSKASSVEMKKRFEKLSTGRSYGVTFGTFHGVFYNILKRSGRIGSQSVLSEKEKVMLLREMLKEHYPEEINTEETERDLIEETAAGIADTKNNLSDVPDGLLEVYTAYEEKKQKLGLIDFEDMISMVFELLNTDKEILSMWQDKFKYILVDEFQDVNKAQYEVLKLLASPEDNIFVVGDDDQSIYGFRGASPDIMQQFIKEYPRAREIVLNVNYRSTTYIVSGALRVISHNKKRFQKEIRALDALKEPVHVQETRDAHDEAEYVIGEIAKKRRAGVPYSEIAVLYRTAAETRVLVTHLIDNNIPFTMKDNIPDIYEHFISKDIIAYLRIAADDVSRRNYLRIINKPLRYISRESFRGEQVDFDDIKDYYKDKEWMLNRVEQLEWDLKMLGNKKTPYTAISYVREKIGYNKYIIGYCEEKNINAKELKTVIDELQEMSIKYSTISEWLDYIDNRPRSSININKNGVVLSSIHASKGLEYDSVIIIRANEGSMPHSKAVFANELEEERRLFYVAMTRAKRKLIITYVKERNKKQVNPSVFVSELISRK